MASQGFTEDLKHLVRDSAVSGRAHLSAVQRSLRAVPDRLRAMPQPTRMKLGVCVAVLAVIGGALLLRSPARTVTHRALARASVVATGDAPRAVHGATRSYATGSSEETHGEYKAAAQSYATAAKKGDARGLNKLLAMTRAAKCEARSEAADALADFRNKKAITALKRLAGSKFKDEPKSPGLFSCSSRRAAQKALEKQGHG